MSKFPRVLAWVILVLCLWGVTRAVSAFKNPWSVGPLPKPASGLLVPGFSAESLRLPSCGEKCL